MKHYYQSHKEYIWLWLAIAIGLGVGIWMGCSGYFDSEEELESEIKLVIN